MLRQSPCDWLTPCLFCEMGVGEPTDSSPICLVVGQEHSQAGACPPIKALESKRPTPLRRTSRQNKVMSFTFGMAWRGHWVQTVICVFWCHSNVGGYLGREKRLLPCCSLQGGLHAGGIGQDVGKENVNPTPQPKPPRMPRAKKVSMRWLFSGVGGSG